MVHSVNKYNLRSSCLEHTCTNYLVFLPLFPTNPTVMDITPPAPSPNSSGAVPTGISARSVDADLNKAGAAPGLSVADLLDKVGLAIRDTFPRSVWVIGEIQNIAHRKQGVFLQLAEPGDARQHRTLTVSASIWQSALRHMVQKHGNEVPAQILQDGLRSHFGFSRRTGSGRGQQQERDCRARRRRRRRRR